MSWSESNYNTTKATVNLTTLTNGLWEASNPDGFNYTNATVTTDEFRPINETFTLYPEEKVSFFLHFETATNMTLPSVESESFLQW
mmetsp:Transcript_36473/g.55995  ORF Transcript_36473/g.55995 Transcript_36473/m.55995 type:complete len:86 (+) Transcript_36473:584-841(+)